MQSKLSTTLETVSAIAVVISLVFVGLEIRNSTAQTEQNTRTLQMSAYQDLIGRIVEMNAIAIEQGATIEMLLAIDTPNTTETEKLNSLLWILFRHGDMAYFQFETSSISAERTLSAMAPLLSRFEHPRVVKRWNEVKIAFVPAYRAYIDNQIELIEDAPGDT